MFSDFHGYGPRMQKIENFDLDGGLIKLAKAVEISYRSDKYGGDPLQEYTHDFEKPFPNLYTNLAGNILVIKGRFKIDKRGIVG